MASNQNPACKIGDRIECGSSLGTVRFIGPLEGKPSMWLGVDWDEPERGKHNGSLNGTQYFTTKHPKSGSFVRPEKVNFGKSALSSIESRYGHLEDEFTAKINQQKQLLIQHTMNAPFLEMVGFDKVFNKQSDFSALKIVNLRDQNVNSAGLNLGEVCPNIEELDISKNLLVSWRDIFVICDQLPKLHWLNVSENLLEVPENMDDVQYDNVRTLICGSMHLTWDDVCIIAKIFKNVEEFRVPNNEIHNLGTINGFFTKLKLLDLEGNKIENWNEICHLGLITTLEQLILENIQLLSIEFVGIEPKVSIFKGLKKLGIANNLINEWRSIGELNRLENLEHLKISKNPIINLESHGTGHQVIIARIANLKILNGVEIESGERRGAEYDYIKKYGLEWLNVKGTQQEAEFLKIHNRYRELIEIYGEPEESELIVKPKMIKTSLIELNLTCEGVSVVKKMPPTLTVQKFRVLTQKIFKLKERPQLTYISNAEDIEISLEDETKEIGLYSMQNGDQIIVKQ